MLPTKKPAVILNSCSLCVRFVSENELKLLKQRIQQSIKTLPRLKPYTWKSVQGCAIMGPDMLWYRGQLLEVLGEHVKVQERHTL